MRIIQGDCLEVLQTIPSQSIHCCVTSPPYWGLRDYGVEGQFGLETSPEKYVQNMVSVFREVKRVLKDDGTLWLNIGDSYSGSGKGTAGNFGKKHNQRFLEHKTGGVIPVGTKPKDLVGIPWMLAFALRSDGWYLRSEIIWHKPNPMPESVKDRPTRSHEYIFLLSKSKNYYYDHESIKEPLAESSIRRLSQDIENQQGSTRANGGKKTNGNMKAVGGDDFKKQDKVGKRQYTGFNERWKNGEILKNRNKRTVWTVATKPYNEAHFATYPPNLIEPCILAGSPVGGTVLDPFNGAGTTGLVAMKNNRKYVGIELNPEYIEITKKRFAKLNITEERGEK